MDTIWTDTRIAIVKKMWKAGSSAREIADRLGSEISRNAVIGKVTRLKLTRSSNNTPSSGRRRKKVSPMTKRASPTRSTPFIDPTGRTVEQPPRVETVMTCEPVEYLQLREQHCRALLDRRGSDGLLLSCGSRRLEKPSGGYASSYCPGHDLLFQPGRQH